MHQTFNLIHRSAPTSNHIAFSRLNVVYRLTGINGPLHASRVTRRRKILEPAVARETKRLSRLNLVRHHVNQASHEDIYYSLASTNIDRIEHVIANIYHGVATNVPLYHYAPHEVSLVVSRYTETAISSTSVILVTLTSATSSRHNHAMDRLISCLNLLRPAMSVTISSLRGTNLTNHSRPSTHNVTTIYLTSTNEQHTDRIRRRLRSLQINRTHIGDPSIL